MNRPPAVFADRPAALPLPDLLAALVSLGVTFRREGDTLAMRGSNVLTGELREAVAFHKPALLTLCDLRADLDKLHGRLITLRCSDPPKRTRAQALTWLSRQIDKLAARSLGTYGTVDGWPDPADAFAYGDQITALRAGLAEVEDGRYPVPLPAGCHLLPQVNFDPFEHGRLYNGMVTETQLPLTVNEWSNERTW